MPYVSCKLAEKTMANGQDDFNGILAELFQFSLNTEESFINATLDNLMNIINKVNDNKLRHEYLTKLVKQCSLIEMKDNKQHYSIWLKDKCGDIHLIIKDKSSKTCTYLGCLDGVKFDVVLDNSFFDTLKNYFKEGNNENNNSVNRFSIANNSNVLVGQKIS